MIAIRPFNPDAGLIAGNHLGLTQIAYNPLLCSPKRFMAAHKHIRQGTLAHPQPEHFVKHPCKPGKGNRLKGFQVQN